MQASLFKMIKQNTSKFDLGSGYMASPPAWSANSSKQSSRRRGPSVLSSNKVNASKYSISNANHTIIDDNYTYNVYKYTIYDDANDTNEKINQVDDFYGSYTYDNDNYSTFINGKYTYNDEKCSVYREEKCDKGNDIIKEEEDEENSFTFSSVTDSMEFFSFNSSACSNEAEACMLLRMSSMSPADELFQDGKIRPLIRPIINGYHQPTCSKSFHDQRVSFNEFAVQYLASSNSNVIKHAEKLDHPQGLLHQEELNRGLSSEIDQKSKELCTDQQECEPNYEHNYEECEPKSAELPVQKLSSSAPTSPAKENDEQIIDQQGSPQYYSVVSTSQVSCYRRCRSLSRVFQIEDNEQVLEVQDLVEDGITKGGLLNYKRKTLQDLLTREENSTCKLEMMQGPCNMVHEKQILGLTSPNRDVKSFYDVERRPYLASSPTNTTHLWSTRREKISSSPTSNGKNGKKVGALSPHELHYGSQKAQADRMKKKTFLPYRPGLLGCLGYPPQ